MPSRIFDTKNAQTQVIVFVHSHFEKMSHNFNFEQTSLKCIFVLMPFRIYSLSAHCVEIIKEESICGKKRSLSDVDSEKWVGLNKKGPFFVVLPKSLVSKDHCTKRQVYVCKNPDY